MGSNGPDSVPQLGGSGHFRRLRGAGGTLWSLLGDRLACCRGTRKASDGLGGWLAGARAGGSGRVEATGLRSARGAAGAGRGGVGENLGTPAGTPARGGPLCVSRRYIGLLGPIQDLRLAGAERPWFSVPVPARLESAGKPGSNPIRAEALR